MILFDFFRPERNKKKLEELKKTLQINPEYYKELKTLKLKRDANPYM
ncbi:MAG: hypothetical protein ACFE94_02470 [Candidatus Hodarchaeota archaeon]